MSALGGIQPCPIPNQKDGTLKLDDIRDSIRSEDVHHPITRLVCLENTQNICGGVPLTPEYTRQVGELAHRNGLLLHMDGARIFNAAVAQNVSVKALVDPADSVMFCLSKGLAAPVGSILAGSQKFIARARHIRKMLGGGMRQVGEDTQVPVVLTQEQLKSRLSKTKAEIICLDSEWERIAGESTKNVDSGVKPENAAYVIYTTGSTGKPKGVVNEHRGIVNRLLWMQAEYGLGESDRVLQKHAV